MRKTVKNKFTAVVALISVFVLSLFCGCADENEKQDKISVTATLFPQYDFCRQIVGDRAEVTLILPAGCESHNYEPSVADIKKIKDSDLFLYTGESMEPWAERILDGINVKSVDVSDNIELCAHEHNSHSEHGHGEEHGEHENHEHESDPHIWTNPLNCVIMTENILAALCEIDGENAEYYKNNAEAYISELRELDGIFSEISAKAKQKTVIHGGRASLTYFAKRYGFTFISAVDSCSSYSEPGAAKLTQMINTVKENKIPVVFYEELTEPKFAKLIAEETGAEILLFHTCHNLSKDDFNQGKTYISLMRQNAQNLKKALGVE